MTLLIPTILHAFIKILLSLMNVFDYVIRYLETDLSMEILDWLSYLFLPSFMFIISHFHHMVVWFFAIPIYFWTLLWHPNGRSIIAMLKDPNGHGRFLKHKQYENKFHWRERSRDTPFWVKRSHRG